MKRDERWKVTLREIPDPVLAETLEMIGIQYVAVERSWFVIVDDGQLDWYVQQLESRHVLFDVAPATGRGELQRYDRLSDHLVLADGGSPSRCALCGVAAAGACVEQVECDDTDSPDYPGARSFYVCPQCYQQHVLPSPRAYMARHAGDGGEASP
jgi:hypothetical protein